MAIYAAQRISDGFLTVISDVPNLPSNLVQRAIDGYGGDPEDWQVVTLTPEDMALIPPDLNGGTAHLINNAIVIQHGFPNTLKQRQQSAFQRGFITHKTITDFRTRKVTRIGVI